jgi:hypothetical protein
MHCSEVVGNPKLGPADVGPCRGTKLAAEARGNDRALFIPLPVNQAPSLGLTRARTLYVCAWRYGAKKAYYKRKQASAKANRSQLSVNNISQLPAT